MTTHESRTEREEVPFGAGSFQHITGVDTHLIEYLRKLIHKSNVDIALTVFNYLGGFGHFHCRRQMCTGGDHACVNLIHIHPNLSSGTGCHFLDMLYSVQLVARIDAFGTITGKEIDIELQTRNLFYYRNTFILRHTRIHRRFINNDISFGNDFPNSGTGTVKRGQIRIIVLINRSRNCYYIKIAIFYVINVGCTSKTMIANSILKKFITHLKSSVMTSHQCLATFDIHVETNSRILSTEQASQRKTDVTETNYTNFYFFHCFVFNYYFLPITNSPYTIRWQLLCRVQNSNQDHNREVPWLY